MQQKKHKNAKNTCQGSSKNVTLYYTKEVKSMIRNRLAELLAERGLKISRVAAEIPNLSRNTITSTSQNSGKMIQLETINSLCQYLGISPTDFFEYLPFDVKCDVAVTKNETFASDVTMMSIPVHPGELTIDVYLKIESAKSKTLVFGYSGEVLNKSYWGATLEFNLKKDDQGDFKSIWNDKITPGFRGTIWWEIKQKIADALNVNMQKRFSNSDFSTADVPIDSGAIILTTDFETDEVDLGELPF